MQVDREARTTDPRTATRLLRRYQLVLSMLVAFTVGATFPALASVAVQIRPIILLTGEEVPLTTSSSMILDYHQEKIDRTKSWCPAAKCIGSDLCRPCKRRWLIIVSPGRAGSTTLSEMMHRLSGMRISRENHGAANRMHAFLELIARWVALKLVHGDITNLRRETWSCFAQHFFEVINPPNMRIPRKDQKVKEHLEPSEETAILGFKTTNFLADPEKDFFPDPTPEHIKKKVMIMNRLLPCARFIVKTRSDITGQQRSWQTHMEKIRPLRKSVCCKQWEAKKPSF